MRRRCGSSGEETASTPTRRTLLQLAVLRGPSAALARPAAPGGYDAPSTVATYPEPPAPALREGVAPAGTARLWWWDTGGSGPVVVLMHPATGSGKVWRYQQHAFVRAGFRVIGYSRRGAAGSTAGDPGDPASPTDDLQALLRQLGVRRFHLVATAAGAFVAIDHARRAPETLLSLTLANTLLGATGGEVDPMLAALQLPVLEKLPVDMRELGPAYRTANPAGTARWLELVKGSAAMNGAGRRRPPRDRLTLDDLRTIAVPVLLIAGDADLLAPPPLMRAFARYLPDARFATLPAVGHSGYWEAPDLFNETVIAFLDGARGRA